MIHEYAYDRMESEDELFTIEYVAFGPKDTIQGYDIWLHGKPEKIWLGSRGSIPQARQEVANAFRRVGRKVIWMDTP